MAHLQTFAEWECLVIILEAGIRETEQVRPPGWSGLLDELESVYHTITRNPTWLSTDALSQPPPQ